MFDVIGIGSPAVDYFFETDNTFLHKLKLKPEDDFLFTEKNIKPTEIFDNLNLIAKSPGGIVTNTLEVLSTFGCKTSYFATIGSDQEGEYWLKNIKGINKKNIFIKGKMTKCICLLTNNGKSRTFLSDVNENEIDFMKKIKNDQLNNAKIIHIGPLISEPEKGIELTLKLMARIKEPLISFSPSIYYTKYGASKLEKVIKKTDIIFVNSKELRYLIGKNPKEGSKYLVRMGTKIVVCTLAEKGSLVTTKDMQFNYSRVNTKKIIDTTGAGDSYAAGFLYGLLKNKSLEWSARNASVVASNSLSDYGLNWIKKNGFSD